MLTPESTKKKSHMKRRMKRCGRKRKREKYLKIYRTLLTNDSVEIFGRNDKKFHKKCKKIEF